MGYQPSTRCPLSCVETPILLPSADAFTTILANSISSEATARSLADETQIHTLSTATGGSGGSSLQSQITRRDIRPDWSLKKHPSAITTGTKKVTEEKAARELEDISLSSRIGDEIWS